MNTFEIPKSGRWTKISYQTWLPFLERNSIKLQHKLKKRRSNTKKISSYAGKKKLTLRQAETLSEVFLNTTKEPFHFLVWMECNFSAVAAISKKSWNTHYLQHILRDRLLQLPNYNDRMWRVTLRNTGLERWLPQEWARDQTLRPGWITLLVGLFPIPGESYPLSTSLGEQSFVSKMKENHSLRHNHSLLPTSSVWWVFAAIQQQRDVSRAGLLFMSKERQTCVKKWLALNET